MKRRTGAVLVGLALCLVMAAAGWWAWENSDSREYDREVDALAGAFSGGAYDEAGPNATVSLVLAGLGAVLFLGGMVLIAAPPDRSVDLVDPGSHSVSD